MEHRLQHDIAFSLAHRCTGMVANAFREEEWGDIHAEFYKAAMEALADYSLRLKRERQRLTPIDGSD